MQGTHTETLAEIGIQEIPEMEEMQIIILTGAETEILGIVAGTLGTVAEDAAPPDQGPGRGIAAGDLEETETEIETQGTREMEEMEEMAGMVGMPGMQEM